MWRTRAQGRLRKGPTNKTLQTDGLLAQPSSSFRRPQLNAGTFPFVGGATFPWSFSGTLPMDQEALVLHFQGPDCCIRQVYPSLRAPK